MNVRNCKFQNQTFKIRHSDIMKYVSFFIFWNFRLAVPVVCSNVVVHQYLSGLKYPEGH